MVLALAACGAGVALGNWQAGRAAQKRALGEALERSLRGSPIEVPRTLASADSLVLKHVVAKGRFLEEHTVYLDNKLRRGQPGYEVVTPLQLNGVSVLVMRGWVAAGKTRDELPRVATPPGETQVVGLALARIPHALEPASIIRGKVRQNLDIEGYAKETGLALQPVVIEQHSPAPDGLARDWTRPDAGIEKHQSYSLQWYSLAALAIVLLIVLSFRRVGAP